MLKLRGIFTLIFFTMAGCVCAIPSACGNIRLAFDSTKLDFGTVAVLGAKDLTIEVWDTASVDIEIDQFTLSGIDAGDFSVLSPTAPLVVNAGMPIHTKIIVQFRPQAMGTRSGLLLIETSDGNVTVPLTGIGAGNQSRLAWSASAVNFGTITPGSARDSVIELYSNGTDTAIITGIELAAADTSFAANVFNGPPPPFSLAPGDSVAVLLAFQGLPLIGLKNAQLSAIGNSNIDAPSCMLAGDVELGAFKIQPSPIDFGTMYEGQVHDSIIFLVNTDSLDLVIEDLSLSPSGDDFTIVPPITLPFTLRGGDTLAITIRANPGRGTSHESQLLVVSQSADPNFGSARLTVALRAASISAPSNQKLIYYCASSTAIADTVSIADTGSSALVITGLAFSDTNVLLEPNVSFPDTLTAGAMQNLIFGFDPSRASKDTLLLQFLGGDQIIFTDTIALRPSVANVSASMKAMAASGARQNIGVAATASLAAFDLDTIIVHLLIQDLNVASIDPSSIALDPSLLNATLTSVLPELGGFAVTITSTVPISAVAGSPLINFVLDRFVSITDSTDISATIETPQRTGCIQWLADTTRVSGAEACGSTELRDALSGRPLIRSASLREDPARGGMADFRINASWDDKIRYELSNAIGETVAQDFFQLQAGSNDCNISLSNLPSGTYIVRLLPALGFPVFMRFLYLH